MFNKKGIAFLQRKTLELDVHDIKRAAIVIGDALAERDVRAEQNKPLDTDAPFQFGQHLAWLIGFDRLVGDRDDIRNIVEKLDATE